MIFTKKIINELDTSLRIIFCGTGKEEYIQKILEKKIDCDTNLDELIDYFVRIHNFYFGDTEDSNVIFHAFASVLQANTNDVVMCTMQNSKMKLILNPQKIECVNIETKNIKGIICYYFPENNYYFYNEKYL